MDDLQRFVEAQAGVFDAALEEICAGRKETHWMWFIFPQLAGLGSSATATRFAIANLEHARAYLAHPILGARLRQAAEAVLTVKGMTAEQIFGYPDHLKLRSCATVFAQIAELGSPFHQILTAYYGGQPDGRTLDLLARTRD
jgi:uncharacterized protein (DUF1810 family)